MDGQGSDHVPLSHHRSHHPHRAGAAGVKAPEDVGPRFSCVCAIFSGAREEYSRPSAVAMVLTVPCTVVKGEFWGPETRCASAPWCRQCHRQPAGLTLRVLRRVALFFFYYYALLSPSFLVETLSSSRQLLDLTLVDVSYTVRMQANDYASVMQPGFPPASHVPARPQPR